MNIILLPGNTSANKEWIDKVAAVLGPDFESVTVQYYGHWEAGGELVDIEKEVEKLTVLAKDLGGYVVFAKSVGTLIALKAIKEKKINPQKCIFVGVPVYWARDRNVYFQNWIVDFSTPTLFVQHKDDPVISSENLRRFLDESRVINYKFLELPGNSHDYLEFKTLAKLASEFIYEN